MTASVLGRHRAQIRRAAGALTSAEQQIREVIVKGLIKDKGGAAQVSTAMRVVAEVIASDDLVADCRQSRNRRRDGIRSEGPRATEKRCIHWTVINGANEQPDR